MTPCSKTEICHSGRIIEIAREKRGSGINEMVIYRFHYVMGQRLRRFHGAKACLTKVVQQGFPTFLTEV